MPERAWAYNLFADERYKKPTVSGPYFTVATDFTVSVLPPVGMNRAPIDKGAPLQLLGSLGEGESVPVTASIKTRGVIMAVTLVCAYGI
jgi:hypothetical protein